MARARTSLYAEWGGTVDEATAFLEDFDCLLLPLEPAHRGEVERRQYRQIKSWSCWACAGAAKHNRAGQFSGALCLVAPARLCSVEENIVQHNYYNRMPQPIGPENPERPQTSGGLKNHGEKVVMSKELTKLGRLLYCCPHEDEFYFRRSVTI